MPASCLLMSAFDNRPCMAVSVYSKSASVWKGAQGQGSDRGWKMGPEASIERDDNKVNEMIVGVGSREWGCGITLMNSSGRLGPSTSIFTLVPTGIDNLDLLTGNGSLGIPSPGNIQWICLHNGIFHLRCVASFHKFVRVRKAYLNGTWIFHSCCNWCWMGMGMLILVANYPFHLASTLMPIKEMLGSVSLTIPTLPIEQVDLNLWCFSFLSRHEGKMRRSLNLSTESWSESESIIFKSRSDTYPYRDKRGASSPINTWQMNIIITLISK